MAISNRRRERQTNRVITVRNSSVIYLLATTACILVVMLRNFPLMRIRVRENKLEGPPALSLSIRLINVDLMCHLLAAKSEVEEFRRLLLFLLPSGNLPRADWVSTRRDMAEVPHKEAHRRRATALAKECLVRKHWSGNGQSGCGLP